MAADAALMLQCRHNNKAAAEPLGSGFIINAHRFFTAAMPLTNKDSLFTTYFALAQNRKKRWPDPAHGVWNAKSKTHR